MMRLRQKSERSKKSSGGYGAASSHVVLIPFHYASRTTVYIEGRSSSERRVLMAFIPSLEVYQYTCQ